MEDDMTFRHIVGGYSPFATGIFFWFAIPTVAISFNPSQGLMLFVLFSSVVGGIVASVVMEKLMVFIGWR